MPEESMKMTITFILKDEVYCVLEGYRVANNLTQSKIIEDLIENTLLERA